MLTLCLTGVPAALQGGLTEAVRELPIHLSDDGIPVTVRPGDCLRARLTAGDGEIVYHKPVELFRALAHLAREGVGCDLTERPCFETDGFMYDASRNAVPTCETVRLLLRRMALMGQNLFMLYTEDTYEVEGYPYFGYMRGGFTKQELRALDDYAYALGIEMIPCIQTLGHSWNILRWRENFGEIQDAGGVLLAGEEKTYDYLRQILRDASEPFRSNRIHIGMDETHGLGTGEYRRRHGDCDALSIFQAHLARVRELCQELGLRPMIWSDMYFTLLSPERDYDPAVVLPDSVLSQIPDDVGMVYWDYYHHDEAFYRGVIAEHQRCRAPLWFAGGLWTWCTPVVNQDFMLSTTLPGLRASRDCGVREVFTTAWGDDGAQSSPLCVLFGLQVYAEFDYTGEYDEAEVKRRFSALHGADAEAFWSLSRFDMVPGVRPEALLAPTTATFLLAEDPLTLLFEKDLEGVALSGHYEALAVEYRGYREAATAQYRPLWEFCERLASVLWKKCLWRERAPAAVRSGDRAEAARLAGLAEELYGDVLAFADCQAALWEAYNRPFGYDILDMRMGGLAARMRTAGRRMRAFAEGGEPLPELLVKKLPYGHFDGHAAHFFGSFLNAATVSVL